MCIIACCNRAQDWAGILELLNIYWALTLEPCANTGQGGSEAGIQAKGASGMWGTFAS